MPVPNKKSLPVLYKPPSCRPINTVWKKPLNSQCEPELLGIIIAKLVPTLLTIKPCVFLKLYVFLPVIPLFEIFTQE